MPLRIMTFNIRYGAADDGQDSWRFRHDLVIETIRDRNPDILSLQEPNGEQWEELVAALPGMRGIFGDAKDNGPYPHGVGLMFRADRFDLLGQRVFWQSGTPDVPGSITFPNHWGPRPTVVAQLRDRAGGREFAFAATHLDTHAGCWLPSARVNAEELEKTAPGLPAIIAGDFNCAAGSEAWKFLTGEAGFRDAWREAGLSDEGVTTFHQFHGIERLPIENPDTLRKWLEQTTGSTPEFVPYIEHVLTHRNYRIDWIMLKGALKALSAGLDTRKRNGRCASDHWAVVAEIGPVSPTLK